MNPIANSSPVCPAITIDNVSKHFRIRHQGGSIKQAMLGVFRRKHIEEFTALNNISFTVNHGETVAIIGRNGSGKSTLLSLLARVYKPSSGKIALLNPSGERARVAPLLELGAGFHPDLTGLQNITFYGSLLGMTSQELRERQEEIVQFAELEGKIDTYLRGWNNGAKLRLGFAIAVHTNPDILLVDEVLAVGDEAFQNKCFRLIRKLQEQGKTILFVSHDLHAVEMISSRVIWINQSHLQIDGDTESVLRAYRADST